jgi:hypothetical protein
MSTGAEVTGCRSEKKTRADREDEYGCASGGIRLAGKIDRPSDAALIFGAASFQESWVDPAARAFESFPHRAPRGRATEPFMPPEIV